MFIIILTLLIGIYVLVIPFRTGLLGWSKAEISEKGTKQLRKIHLALLILLLVLWLLATREIYLRGYWTTKILFWEFFFSGILLFVFRRKEIQSKLERFYYGLFFWLPIGLVPICLFPILGWFLILSINCHTIGNKRDILYSDSNYRIQKIHSVTGSSSSTALFVKRGILEFKQNSDIISDDFINDVDHFTITETSGDNLKIQIFYKGSFFDPNPSVTKIKIDN